MLIIGQTKTFSLGPSEQDKEMVEIIACRPKQDNKVEMPGWTNNAIKYLLRNSTSKSSIQWTSMLYTRHAVILVHMISFKYAREIWEQNQNSRNIWVRTLQQFLKLCRHKTTPRMKMIGKLRSTSRDKSKVRWPRVISEPRLSSSKRYTEAANAHRCLALVEKSNGKVEKKQ